MGTLGPVSTLKRWREPGDTVFDFANMAVIDPRWAVARSSEKTHIDDQGVRRKLAINTVAIVNDPACGRCLDIEPQSTNQIPNSNSPAVWGGGLISIDPASVISVAGVNMGKFVPTTGSGTHYVDRIFGAQVEGTPLSAQAHLMLGEHRWVAVDLFSNGANSCFRAVIDLFSMAYVVVTNATGATMRLQRLAGGVVLVLIEGAAYQAGSTAPRLRLAPMALDGGQGSYRGDGTSGAYFGGVQAENRRTCTSLILTGASAVTRPSDVLTLSGSSLTEAWNPVSGVVYLDAYIAQETSGTTGYQIQMSSGASDRIDHRRTTGAPGRLYAQILKGESSVAGQSAAVPADSRFLVATRWNGTETRVVSSGGAIVVSTVALFPPAIATSIRLGASGLGAHFKVKSLRVSRNGDESMEELLRRVTL